MTTDTLERKLNSLILEVKQVKKDVENLKLKIDNFLGFEDVGKKELERLKKIEKEIDSGNYYTLEELKKEFNL
jgi:hypothetical protein